MNRYQKFELKRKDKCLRLLINSFDSLLIEI